MPQTEKPAATAVAVPALLPPGAYSGLTALYVTPAQDVLALVPLRLKAAAQQNDMLEHVSAKQAVMLWALTPAKFEDEPHVCWRRVHAA